jgi:hypothetical protein
MEGHATKSLTYISQNCQVIKNKESTRKSHSQGEPEESWQLNIISKVRI